MLDVRLKYMGSGVFHCTNQFDVRQCEEAAKIDEVLRAQLTHPRTIDQNRLFHALCEQAFANMPENHPHLSLTIVPTWRHLKSWMLVKLDYCAVERFEPAAMTPSVAASWRLRDDSVQIFVDEKTKEIIVRTAMSTRRLSKADFSELLDKVIDLIATTVVPGSDPKAWLEIAKGEI